VVRSNLLASKRGRLTAFFFLYVAEGIPHGFVQIAIASRMGLQGLTSEQIGWFTGIVVLPWAFKWAAGPLVDLVHSNRLGRRRGWIAAMQILMIATVIAVSPVDFTSSLTLFTVLLVALNVFSAVQDVAIDALACGVLQEAERGVANGLMFGGSYLGATLGGSGALAVMPVLGYGATFVLVAVSLALILLCVTRRLREKPGPERFPAEGSRVKAVGGEIAAYARDAFRAFFGTRAAVAGLAVSLLPIGAIGISLAPINAKLAVDLGLQEQDLAAFNFVTGMLSTVTCIVGGWLSDRVGRRRCVAGCVLGTGLTTVLLAWILHRYGWTLPLAESGGGGAVPPHELVVWFWGLCTAHAFFLGLMYGVRIALFMDICTPAVAATQFTAYMACLNLVTAYSSAWQGWFCARRGYVDMLAVDAAAGMVVLALLPFLSPPKAPRETSPSEGGASPTHPAFRPVERKGGPPAAPGAPRSCEGSIMNPSDVRRVRVVDSHTGGEPTRVVVEGGPDLGAGSLAERRERFRRDHDHFRSAVVNEPRGSDVLVGALLGAPADPSCAAGVIFFNNVGYLGMCGHGTIGLVATLAHLGRIGPGEHRVETPVGVVTTRLHPDGRVSVRNVPSRRTAAAVPLDVPGLGRVTGDVAWGGNWFFLCSDHGLAVRFDNLERLADAAWRIRRELARRGVAGDDGGEIDHIELFGPPQVPGADSKSFVLCPGRAYDRSPCGTGTSAKLACLHADGALAPGRIWRQESIIGSVFEGSIEIVEGRVVPTITGTTYVNAESELILDPRDPYNWGIR